MAEGARLLSVYRVSPYPGFESRSLRQKPSVRRGLLFLGVSLPVKPRQRQLSHITSPRPLSSQLRQCRGIRRISRRARAECLWSSPNDRSTKGMPGRTGRSSPTIPTSNTMSPSSTPRCLSDFRIVTAARRRVRGTAARTRQGRRLLSLRRWSGRKIWGRLSGCISPS